MAGNITQFKIESEICWELIQPDSSTVPLTGESTPNSSTLFIRDVGKIDCATFDPSQGISGQSWYVDVWLTGMLDENGFVFDFSPLKSLIKQTLSSTLDHSLIIPVQSQSVQYGEWEGGEKWILKSKARGESKESRFAYQSPSSPFEAEGSTARGSLTRFANFDVILNVTVISNPLLTGQYTL